MALCHPSLPDGKGKLILPDAENAWFVRVNHLEHYGTDVHLERLAAEPPEPLLFLNIDAVPGSRALAWEHIEDAPGKRCPNPRLIIPRKAFPGVVEGAVTVDIRSFGVRTPPCTKERPSYGILGVFLQGLNQKVEQKEARIQTLERELAALKDLVAKLAGARN